MNRKTVHLDIEFRDIVEAASDPIIVTKAFPLIEPGPEIVYVNPAFTSVTGYTFDEAIGRSPRFLHSGETPKSTITKIRSALECQASVRAKVKNRLKNGELCWMEIYIHPLRNEKGEVTHFVSIERDISDTKNLEEELERLSRTDSLTGLGNRRALYEMMEKEFNRFQRHGVTFSLLMIDLDYFKCINDQYGHGGGDKVLVSIGKILSSMFRAEDQVTRIGGEEFCVVLPGSNLCGALDTAERLRKGIEQSEISFDGALIHLTGSFGVAEISHSDEIFEQLIQRADKALYEAKRLGRNKTITYHA